MFVLPLSLAAAVTIRVGFRLGQGSTLDAQTSARTGVGVGRLHGRDHGDFHHPDGANRLPFSTTTTRKWWYWPPS
nr:multi antimicrobial extrusion protein (Na(+)/drug antiporter) [Raoultella sp. NCTC 9187]